MKGFLVLSSLILLCLGAGAQTSVKKKTSSVVAAPVHDWEFLKLAEDVEREAWWVLTSSRLEGNSSPFRIFRVAGLLQDKNTKSKEKINFCKTLLVIQQSADTWRIESGCRKPTEELGTLQVFNKQPEKWRVRWKVGPFSSHFGLGTSILYSQMSCELELNEKKRLRKMSCPGYARNRVSDEVVELKEFEYVADDKNLIKIQGDVKKDLHVVATIKSEVPLTGDIVVTEKKIPQKSVEQKTEFTHIKPSVDVPKEIIDGQIQKSIQEEKNSEKSSESNDEKTGENQKVAKPIEEKREDYSKSRSDSYYYEEKPVQPPKTEEGTQHEPGAPQPGAPQPGAPPIAPGR